MNAKRPEKVKLDVVTTIPNGLSFQDSPNSKAALYTTKLNEAVIADGWIVIMADDQYMRHQLRAAAKKLKLKFSFAIAGDKLYIKPVRVEGDMQRLMLLLREPRTLAELEGKGLQLALQNTLSGMANAGHAHVIKGKWVLTEKGMDLL